MTSKTLARWTFALLLTSLALAGVLAYQAERAAASHRGAAERTLREYASITAWEVAAHVRQDQLATHFLLFSRVNRAVGGQIVGGGRALPVPVDTLAAMIGAEADRCACAVGVKNYFRLDFADSSLAVTGDHDVPAAARRWIRDTILAVSGAAGSPLPASPSAQAPIVARFRDGRERVMAGLVTNFGQATLYGGPDGRAVLVYLVPRTADGQPLAAYGFVADARAFVAPLLDGVLAKQRLLPPALSRGAPTDSLVSLTVRDGAGRALYESRTRFPESYVATDTLDAHYGALRIGVALNPRVARRALPGGLPQSRLPLVALLFSVTAGLSAVALVQLRRQQELVRTRADFVSGVSHELRTPLAQIRLLAELLHMGKPEGEAGRRRAARVIDQESRRLSYLVENILAFSRSERGNAPIATTAVDVAAEASEVLEMFAPLAESAGARLTLRAPASAVASADGGAVRQILLNFLDNATRYGPRGQEIVVGVERVDPTPADPESRAAPGGGVVRVWVEDEGPGVPMPERTRVFEPYYRMARDAVVTGGGSGIGLAVVRDLVRRQGGRVWIESRAHGAPGRQRPGVRFVVEFAAAGAADEAPPRVMGPPAPGRHAAGGVAGSAFAGRGGAGA